MSSLADICTVSYVQAALPANGTLQGISMLPSTVVTNAVYNATAAAPVGGGAAPSGTFNYCNVTVSYAHTGKGDEVVLSLAYPAPDEFNNRWYIAGGGGFALATDATGGLEYGAASGWTDAGYGGGVYTFDEVNLWGNGTIEWDNTYMFSYQALGELTEVGKAIATNLYEMGDEKLYSYYEGCSDGGRQGMSQVQRWGNLYDGAVVGAPAFRFAQQQVIHLFPAVVEQTMDYYPPPCALEKIVNATIAACDPLDGRTDGVVSRSDLCKLQFNLSSIIGESYYCAATTSSSLGFGFNKRAEGSDTSTTPEQNGTVSAQDVAVAQAIYDGLFDGEGKRAYLSWQIGAELSDGEATWDNDTQSWGLYIPTTGGEYITRFIELIETDTLENLDNVTYDTLVEWMNVGMFRYLDSMQTTVPDLSPFYNNGAKMIHYHGEADPSVPAASSVHYWQSVRKAMYPELSDVDALAAMNEWYQLYMVPGAAHCGSNDLQPDGPYPADNMATMIAWVEEGVKPTGLNATVSEGEYAGEVQSLCQFPYRPLWTNDESFDCVFDNASVESWTYDFDAFKIPVF